MSDFAVKAVFKAVDEVTAPLNKMEKSVSEFSQHSKKELDKSSRSAKGFSNTVKSIKRSSHIATVGLRRASEQADRLTDSLRTVRDYAVIPIAVSSAAFVDTLKKGAQFEQTLVNAGVKFQGMVLKGSDSFKIMQDAAAKVGATTEFSASQAAEAIDFLALGGFKFEQAISSLPSVIDLATAAQMDLSQATDIASNSLGAFNLKTDDPKQIAKNLQRINDALVKTSTSSSTSIEDMFETIKESGAVVSSAGVSVEQYSAFVGTLANSAIKGSQAGTALKNIFVRLQAPPSEAAKAIEKLKLSVGDKDGKLRDSIDIFSDIEEKLKNFTKMEQTEILSDLFGMEGLTAAQSLVNSGADSIREFQRRVEESGGASTDMANIMRGTFLADFKSLMSAIEAIQINIFSGTNEKLHKKLKEIVAYVRNNSEEIQDYVTDLILKIIEDVPKIIETFKKVANIAKYLLPAIMALKILAATLGIISAIVNLNPLSLAVIAVLAAIAYLILNFDSLKAAAKVFFMWVGAAVSNIGDKFKDMALKAIGWIKKLFKYSPIGLAFKAGKGLFNMGKNLFSGGPDDKKEGERKEDQKKTRNINSVNTNTVVSKNISESMKTNKSELTIRDETGRAEISGQMSGISMSASGVF